MRAAREIPSGRLTLTVRTVSLGVDRPIPPALKDRVLDAAEAVVVSQGIANLTLDAVAAEARLSKGGLLHYFPSKDHLVEGLVTRCAEYWRAGADEAYDRAPPGPGRMARALLSHLSDARTWTQQCQRSSSAAFAALAQNPKLIQPMRAVYAELRRRLAADGLAPGVGETVMAAMDGLWLNRVLGLGSVDQALMDRMRRTLETLLRPAGSTGRRRPGARAALRGRKHRST